MTQIPEKPDPRLEEWLDSLRATPSRDPQGAARGRAAFLAAAKAALPVSTAPRSRLNHWKNTMRGIFRPQQEKKPMFSTFGTLLLILTLLLGGGGATTAAAQSAQPDGLLYPVKVWSEQARYALTADETARLELQLQFAGRRMAEIQTQLAEGQTPSEALQIRLQSHLQLALTLAAGLPEGQITAALQRVQTALQTHLRAAEAWQSADPLGQQVALQTRAMLQEKLGLCETGLQDPARLRQRLHEQNEATATPTEGGAGGNPWVEGTPTPGSAYGPGPGDNQNPWTDTTPTPGSGYGPGRVTIRIPGRPPPPRRDPATAPALAMDARPAPAHPAPATALSRPARAAAEVRAGTGPERAGRA